MAAVMVDLALLLLVHAPVLESHLAGLGTHLCCLHQAELLAEPLLKVFVSEESEPELVFEFEKLLDLLRD